jgi:hypothetical protein
MLGNRNVANGPRRSGTPPTAAHKSNKHTPRQGQSQGVAALARRRRPRRDAASAQHKHQDACAYLLTTSSSVDDARRPCVTSKEAATHYHTLGLVACIVVGLICQVSLFSRVIGRQAGKMLPIRLESGLDQSSRTPPAPGLLPDPWGRWALQPGGLVYEHSWARLHLVARRVLHGHCCNSSTTKSGKHWLFFTRPGPGTRPCLNIQSNPITNTNA